MKRFLALVSLVVLMAVFVPVSGEAAEGAVSLGATKNRFELDVVAGGTLTSDVSIFNAPGAPALPVHLEFVLWGIDDEENLSFITVEDGLDAASWFTATPRNFIVSADEAQRVQFTVTTPANVSPGSYLVMMRVMPTLPEHYFLEEGPRFIPELGILLFLNVHNLSLDGDAKQYVAHIEEFRVEPSDGESGLLTWLLPKKAEAGVLEDIADTFAAKIRNTGRYHFKSSGFVVVKNAFGITVALIPLPERYLFPGRTRTVRATVPPLFERGDVSIGARVLAWMHDQSYIGPYQATLVLNTPADEFNDQVSQSASLGFWIIPWKLILLLTSLVGASGFVFLGRRRLLLFFRVLLGRE